MNANPIPQEWSNYVTQTGSGLEVIPAVLYDTVTYTDNVSTTLTYFNAVRATADLGNLQQPGMLPSPQSFLIQGLRVFYKTPITVVDSAAAAASVVGNMNDIVLLMNTGILRMTIGEKRYGPWPLWMLPAANFLKGFAAMAGAEAANQTTIYGQPDGPLYGLFPNLMIAPLQNFQVTLEWPAGAVDLSGNMVIQVVFDGQLARAIQ